jgi:hypothetical protein
MWSWTITPRTLVNQFLLLELSHRNRLFINLLSSIVFLEVLKHKIENYCIMKMKEKDLKDKSLVKSEPNRWNSVINLELEEVNQGLNSILNLKLIWDLLEIEESITSTVISWTLPEKPIDSITIDQTPLEPWPKSKSTISKSNITIQLNTEKF